MSFSVIIEKLIESLRCLPGVGPKSAQRMALHLLENRDDGLKLSTSIKEAMERITHCKQCKTFSEDELCQLCLDPKRDRSLLCVVESPSDILAIEQTRSYNGYYFVLFGRLSPLDGIGPEELGMEQLKTLIETLDTKEIILATNHTVESEATDHYIMGLLKQNDVKITRLARGIPLGGELDYVDHRTLSEAITSRNIL